MLRDELANLLPKEGEVVFPDRAFIRDRKGYHDRMGQPVKHRFNALPCHLRAMPRAQRAKTVVTPYRNRYERRAAGTARRAVPNPLRLAVPDLFVLLKPLERLDRVPSGVVILPKLMHRRAKLLFQGPLLRAEVFFGQLVSQP